MDGVHVVEFGTYYAAPLVCRCLTGLGCRVTSVELPTCAQDVENSDELTGPGTTVMEMSTFFW